jgi:2-polyprenyl-6-methoxyphenol hydroxylase-like FAD-dependent oxidoreductase
MAPFKVIIVGGGLAGALLANGLMNNGVEVAIYERDAADSKREGYQIRLGEAAQAGFKACLTGDIRTALLTKLGKSANAGDTAPAICNSRFETLLDLTKFGSYSKSSAINRVVLRDTLLEPVKAAGRVTFQKKLDRYRIISDGGNEHVQLHFSDGSTDTCDILVGADGSRSTVSEILIRATPLAHLSADKPTSRREEPCRHQQPYDVS